MPLKLPRDPIYRPQKLDAELVRRSWECIAEARAALALPPPSTFLGVRDQSAAPKGNEPEQ